MSTPLSCNRHVCGRLLTLVVIAALIGGCGMGGGRLLWALGVGQGKKIKAQCKLGDGPVLVLVDDASQQVDWPLAPRELIDELSQQLIRHKATTKVIPRETIDVLRQSTQDFDKRGAREIGELAEADRVIWIETQGFLADEQVTEASSAAYWSVTVKVLNARETSQRARVRVWPDMMAGYPLNVSLSGALATRLKTRDAIARELASQLAAEVTKLFVDHKPDEFES